MSTTTVAPTTTTDEVATEDATTAKPTLFDLGEIPSVVIECYGNEGPINDAHSSTGGAWLQFRGDRALSGRSGLVGAATCPEVLWSHDLGARLSLLEVAFDPTVSKVLPLPDAGELGNRWDLLKRYEVGESWVDLDGDGWNQESTTSNGSQRVGDLLADLPGYEMVSCDTGQFQVGAGGDDPLPCYLLNRSGGAWETVWTSEPFSGFNNNMSTTGQPLIGDFDDDGEPEVAVLPWYDIQVLDLATGALEATGKYKKDSHDPDDPTTGRPYGFFGAYDLGGDDRSEFVILGDFEMFVSVLGWRDGRLVELWDHQIEAGTTLNKAVHETGASPVADIDGDGTPDIVTSIFNEHGDGQWHVVGFDGLTGTVIVDLVDRHLASLGDLDGDGTAELFVTVTDGPAVPVNGPVEILDVTQGPPRSVWSSASSGFERLDIPDFPLHVNSRATWGRKSILLYQDPQSGGLMFATRSEPQGTGNVTIHFYRAIGGAVSEIGSVTGPLLQLRSIDDRAETLRLLVEAVSSQSGSTVTTDGLEATL
ncbi:MAG: VCBS repeat-containing protein, partial [Acidimicrobiales bacterium]|nr:VCBS repeat-containing protein [Acidimicrobiales bacterium]